MAKREINAIEWTCDSPSCQEVEMVPKSEGDGPPEGWIQGMVSKGHIGPEKYVIHHTKCSRPAMEWALAEAVQSSNTAPAPAPEGGTQ